MAHWLAFQMGRPFRLVNWASHPESLLKCYQTFPWLGKNNNLSRRRVTLSGWLKSRLLASGLLFKGENSMQRLNTIIRKTRNWAKPALAVQLDPRVTTGRKCLVFLYSELIQLSVLVFRKLAWINKHGGRVVRDVKSQVGPTAFTSRYVALESLRSNLYVANDPQGSSFHISPLASWTFSGNIRIRCSSSITPLCCGLHDFDSQQPSGAEEGGGGYDLLQVVCLTQLASARIWRSGLEQAARN